MSNSGKEIHSGECRVTRSSLSTSGASTCIILAALNTETRAGLLGHLSHDDVLEGELLEDAAQAIVNLGPAESTQIRLAGGAIYMYDEEFPESADHNQKVEKRIKEIAEQNGIPLPNINVSWLWGNDEASAIVDCHEGTITVEEVFEGYDFTS